MHPRLQIGDLVVEAYALFFVIAWLVGGAVYYLEIRRRKWPLEKLLFVMVGCLFGAVVGSLIGGVLFFDWSEVVHRLWMLDLAGKSVVGGIAGGFVGVELTKKLVRWPHSTGDAFALAIPLGHAVGRIGCFLGGCCFGSPSDLPWAVAYPAGSLPYLHQIAQGEIAPDRVASLPIHPTPLYELGFDLLLFGLIYALRDRLRIRGSLFRVYLFAYASFRVLLELVRADSPFPVAGGPKPIQVVLLVAAARYAWVLWHQEIAPGRTIAR